MREHYRNKGMTYFQHMRHALLLALISFSAGAKLIIHSILPCFFDGVVFYTTEELRKRNEH